MKWDFYNFNYAKMFENLDKLNVFETSPKMFSCNKYYNKITFKPFKVYMMLYS